MVPNVKVEYVNVGISIQKPGQPEPLKHEIKTSWVIVCYLKDGMDMMLMSGLSGAKTAGILRYFVAQGVGKDFLKPFDVEKVQLDITFKEEGKNEQVQHIDCENALVIYEDNFEAQMYSCGMDFFTALGTEDYVQVQHVVGNVLRTMLTGVMPARGPMGPVGPRAPGGMPLDPRTLRR